MDDTVEGIEDDHGDIVVDGDALMHTATSEVVAVLVNEFTPRRDPALGPSRREPAVTARLHTRREFAAEA